MGGNIFNKNEYNAPINLEHVPAFGGIIYYVSPTGTNSNSGLDPNNQLLTIGAAISKVVPGDAINIMAGTYTEIGLDLNVNACKLWCEIGVIIAPASGTALTISGDYCKITGNHIIYPAAGEIGMLISGDFCRISEGRILTGGTGIRITGTGAIILEYASEHQTSISFDIQGGQGYLYNCSTVGIGATYGYRINNGSDTGVLRNCTSVGHSTSGFYIATGSKDWTLLNCSSGIGDGRWVDTDRANVWSNFSYSDEVFSTTTFAGIPTTYNIFKVTGGVRIKNIRGHVGTAIANTASTLYLQLYSANGTIDITDAPGIDIDSAVVGAMLIRNAPSTEQIGFGNPDTTPAIVENTSWKTQANLIDVVKDDSADTYIRLVVSAALASGAIHWHCNWEPLTEDGFLEAV